MRKQPGLAALFLGVVAITATSIAGQLMPEAIPRMSVAHHNAGERVRHNKKTIFFYISIYPIMMAVIWMGVIADLVRGKIQKW